MTHRPATEQARAIRADRERIAGLLGRYPDISGHETSEILAFLKTARHLDVGLLSSDGRVGSKLDRFMGEHKSHFQLKPAETVAVIAFIVALLALAWLLWEGFQ